MNASLLSATVGVSLKAEHVPEILQSGASGVDYFEIHAENYFNDGGLNHFYLQQIRERFSLSVHGTALGIGNTEGIDLEHLQKLKGVVSRYQPVLVSEHLAFNQAIVHGKRVHAADLLPVLRNEDSLYRLCRHLEMVQSELGCRLLLENISAYSEPGPHEMTEPAFLTALCQITGCGLLVDLNNLYVNGENFSALGGVAAAKAWLGMIDPAHVGQFHLAGSSAQRVHGFLIDDHGAPVSPAVWDLYEYASKRMPQAPVTIEWDTKVPQWPVLHAEALLAKQLQGGLR